jgi:hypothetical protein
VIDNQNGAPSRVAYLLDQPHEYLPSLLLLPRHARRDENQAVQHDEYEPKVLDLFTEGRGLVGQDQTLVEIGEEIQVREAVTA